MRIRKNAKLSPLLFSQGTGSVPVENFQSHVCQLNQSPWDVIPFGSESNQFEGEDSFSTGNVSLGDSIGAVESVASMMDTEEKEMPKIEDMVVEDKEHKMLDDNGEIEEQNGREKNLFCEKIDENGLQCKNKAKDGQSFCEHHLGTFLVSSSNNINSYHHHSSPPSCSTSKKAAAAAAAAAAAGARRARARSGRKGSSSSNPYEFYYYSGFGPLWGKRRGDKSGVSDKFVENEMVATSANVVTITTGSTSNPCSSSSTSSQMDNEDQFDYLDDDDDDEDNEDGAGKKRMRKPVKARSLKSLM